MEATPRLTRGLAGEHVSLSTDLFLRSFVPRVTVTPSHATTPHMTLCPTANSLCHTLCPTLCDPGAEPCSGHLPIPLETPSPIPRALFSLTLFLNPRNQYSHPFVPAITANQPTKAGTFSPSFLVVCFYLLSCYQTPAYTLPSPAPPTHSSDLVRLQKYTHPLSIEANRVVPFPPPSRVQRTSHLTFPQPVSIIIHCRWALLHTFIERHLNIWCHLSSRVSCLALFPAVSSSPSSLCPCPFKCLKCLVHIVCTRSRRALLFPYCCVCVQPRSTHLDFVPKLRCARTIVVLAFGAFASWVIHVSPVSIESSCSSCFLGSCFRSLWSLVFPNCKSVLYNQSERKWNTCSQTWEPPVGFWTKMHTDI